MLLDNNGDLYWVAANNGEPLRYDTDPQSTGWQRFKARLLRVLPIIEQL